MRVSAEWCFMLTAPRFLALVVAVSFAACGDKVTVSRDVPFASQAGAGQAAGRGAVMAMPARDQLQRAAAEPAAQTNALQSAWAAQKLIRTAEVRIQVDSVERAIEAMDSIARQVDALVADVRVNHNDGRGTDAQLTVRVPANRFTAALAALRHLGDVKAENVVTEDVSKAYADLETRLAVTEETVSRLRGLLANRPGKLTDVLEVERELARVVTQLEELKGQRRYYDQRVAISTISVALYEPSAVRRPGLLPGIGEAFHNSITALTISLEWLIYLVTFLVPWLLIAGLAWWINKRWGARRRST
jgi:hypothetical protein